MKKIIQATIAAGFAAAFLAGASISFAADNGGKNGHNQGQNSKVTGAKNKKTGSKKCSSDVNALNSAATCAHKLNAKQ